MLDLASFRWRAENNKRLGYTLELIEEIEQLRAKLAATESELTNARELLNLSLNGSDDIRAKLKAAEEKIERLVEEFTCLQESSEGVAGLHLNGDLADWEWLLNNNWLEQMRLCIEESDCLAAEQEE